MVRLPDCEKSLRMCLLVSIQYMNVTDGQTLYEAALCITLFPKFSRGKNGSIKMCLMLLQFEATIEKQQNEVDELSESLRLQHEKHQQSIMLLQNEHQQKLDEVLQNMSRIIFTS